MEESARLERCKEKQALELAMKDTQTLAGFDMETDLKLSLLHQQLKVTVKTLKEIDDPPSSLAQAAQKYRKRM